MNFALGVDFILPLVRFAESGDKQYLQPLTTQQNEDMHALWQLQYDGPKPQVWWRDEGSDLLNSNVLMNHSRVCVCACACVQAPILSARIRDMLRHHLPPDLEVGLAKL
jgi:hypothetical protein